MLLTHCVSYVIRKNKVTDNLVKIELDMDQGSMEAIARLYDKNLIIEHNLLEKIRLQNMFTH